MDNIIIKRLHGTSSNEFSIGLGLNKVSFTTSADELTITKNINLGSYKITSSSIPTGDYDLTNKQYVDKVVAAGAPIATAEKPGLVQPDNDTITIDENGIIKVNGSATKLTTDNIVWSDDIHALGIGEFGGITEDTVWSKGQTLTATLRQLIQKRLDPTVTQPSVSAVFTNDGGDSSYTKIANLGTYLIGSIKKLNVLTSFNPGNYEYYAVDVDGNKTTATTDTGVDYVESDSAYSIKVNNVAVHAASEPSSTVESILVPMTTGVTSYTASVSVNHTEGYVPYDNFENEVPDFKITAGTKNSNSISWSARAPKAGVTNPAIASTVSQTFDKAAISNTYEVGTQVTFTITPKITNGSYQYGSATYGGSNTETGVTFSNYAVSVNDVAIDTVDPNSVEDITYVADISKEGANTFKFVVSCDYSAGVTPYTELSTEAHVIDGYSIEGTAIAAGSLSKTITVTFTGVRSAYYGTYTTVNELDSSDDVQALESINNPAKGTAFSISIPDGAMQVVIAYPASIGEINTIKDTSLNLNIKGSFEMKTLEVNGYNDKYPTTYNVYYLNVLKALQANTYEITI